MNIDKLTLPHDKKVSLAKLPTDHTAGVKDEEAAEARLEECRGRLAELQERLWAQDRWGVLLVFQAMDAAGKDGTIKFVMSGLNPQGCEVYAFKAPSAEELDHDFMWRFMQRMPERGRIGVFNRSYYEETLVVRVHPELLEKQRIPNLDPKTVWKERFEDINAIERYLLRNGIVTLKFFLHVSPETQLKRLLKRLDKPNKNWKFSEADLAERKLWPAYQEAFEDMLRHTSTKHAPWYVIPADKKWYTRVAVAEVILKRLEALDPRYPAVSEARKAELATLREQLGAEMNP